MTTPFPEPPRVEELDTVSAKLRQNLQRWMSDLKRWGQNVGGGGTGTVTEVDTNLPITGGPITTIGTIDINNFTGDSGTGGLDGAVPAPAAGDAAAGKFLKASGGWAVPPGGSGTVTSITATAPIVATPSPITGVGVISATVFVASGASHATGIVPDPGAVAGSNKFLREDATWATPPTTASVFDWGKYIAGRAVWPTL